MSNNKGDLKITRVLILGNLTTTQRDALTPSNGMVIFNTTTNQEEVYNGSWISSSGVLSVFGRTGVVTAQSGDYTGSQITNVPSGNIAATDIQGAINEIATEYVFGAASSALNALAVYSDTTGKIVKNSGVTLSGGSLDNINATSLTAPTIYGGSADSSILNLRSTSSGTPSTDLIRMYTNNTLRFILNHDGEATFSINVVAPYYVASGSSSGNITIRPQAAAGTYNFNFPTSAGSAGQVMTSQGGGATAMTWTTLGLITAAPSTDVTVSGTTIVLTAGENLVFGDIVYIKSDGKMGKADANSAGLFPSQFMATETIANGDTGVFLVDGIARNDAWNWTVGGAVYLSTTAGGMTQTAPSGTGDCNQTLAYASHADRIYFRPAFEYSIHV